MRRYFGYSLAFTSIARSGASCASSASASSYPAKYSAYSRGLAISSAATW